MTQQDMEQTPKTRLLSGNRVPKKAELVAMDILRDITARQLSPGEVLASEAEMQVQYRVARGSVREALRILEVHGIISLRPGSKGGPVVCDVGPAEFGRMTALFLQATRASLDSLLQARRVIESMMAQVAARERNPELIARLELLLPRMQEVDMDHASREYTDVAMEFHRAICGSSSNGVLNLIAQGLIEAFLSRVLNSPFVPELRRQAMREHRAVIRAIIDGDEEKALSLMTRHMGHYAVNQQAISPLEQMIEWQ